MCVHLITRLLLLVGRLSARKPVLSHQWDVCCYSNWPSKVDPQSCNRSFGGFFVLSRCFLDFSVGVGLLSWNWVRSLPFSLSHKCCQPPKGVSWPCPKVKVHKWPKVMSGLQLFSFSVTWSIGIGIGMILHTVDNDPQMCYDLDSRHREQNFLLHLGLVSSNRIAWNSSDDCPLSEYSISPSDC